MYETYNADYDKLSIVDQVSLEEAEELIVLECRHGYDASTLRRVMVTTKECPLCRQKK